MQRIVQAVEKHRERILAAERFIWAHPETGYREVETSRYMEDAFEALGYTLTRAEGIPGFYTVLDTGREGPEVLVLGELDSILCPTHPDADPGTGAVHACGHNAQCAALLGVAAALKEPHMLDGLSGRIRLCAVPAEELLELEYRSELKRQGRIRYYSGKAEFLYRGYFDGVDMAFMVHTSHHFSINGGSVGCITKRIIYKGLAAHAGGNPWDGHNALYAATCGLNAANALRETFRESDIIRFHPIVTSGGSMVNAIPDIATLESYVRGKTFDAIADANRRINQALIGAALSLNCNVDIIDIPGYAPCLNDDGMKRLARDAAACLMPDFEIPYSDKIGSGSTDMGDLSCIMPIVHPYVAGQMGASHGSDYRVADPETACLTSAKWQLTMLWLLLEKGAERARRILADFTPRFSSKEAYFEYLASQTKEGERIRYTEDGVAKVVLD